MVQAATYRVPRRFITAPREPHPYGLLVVSFTGHVLFFLAALAASTFLGSQLDQSKIYIVNLVPAAPPRGSPASASASAAPARPVARPTRAPEPVPLKPTPPKIEVRTPPRPPKVAETPPPRPEKPAEPLAPPRIPEIARTVPLRPADLALPRRAEKETPALDNPAARDRLVDRALPAPPLPATAAVPRPPDLSRLPPALGTRPVAQGPPAPPTPPTTVASLRPAVEPMRLGRAVTTGPTTGSISLDVSDFPFTYYLRQLQAKISERWAPPRPATAGGERAVIMFEIGRDGSIREPVLEKGSGNALYDQSALRAIAEASPFPPLPAEFKSSSLRVHFGFDFQPDRG